MPGRKISEADRRKINPKFICALCALLLNAPVQTPCGHLLCYVCLQTLLSSPNPTCPSDGTQLKKENTFCDKCTERELMEIHLHCPEEGCNWSGTYKDLQEHSNSCDHALIQCVHNQCKKDVKRCLLPQHLETECLYREVTCSGCNETMAFNLLEEHVNDKCLEASLTCKHCHMTGLRRREIEQHETVECEEISSDCEFKHVGCMKVVKRKDIPQHSRNGLLSHVRLLLKMILDVLAKVTCLIPKVEIVETLQEAHGEMKQEARSFSTQLQSVAEKSTAMVPRVMALERRITDVEGRSGRDGNDFSMATEFNRLAARVAEMSSNCEKSDDKVRRLEIELREKCSEVVRLQERLELLDISVAESTVKLCDLEGPTSFNGTLLWRIEDFSGKRRDAVSGVQTAIYSRIFTPVSSGTRCARGSI